MSLYQTIRKVSEDVNKSVWGMVFRAWDPSGKLHETDALTGEPLKFKQVIYNSVRVDLETGEDIIDPTPNFTIDTQCLNPLPKAGEDWLFELPESTIPGAPMKKWKMSKDRILREDVIGNIQIFCIEVENNG